MKKREENVGRKKFGKNERKERNGKASKHERSTATS
jgi:hypothetical protein